MSLVNFTTEPSFPDTTITASLQVKAVLTMDNENLDNPQHRAHCHKMLLRTINYQLYGPVASELVDAIIGFQKSQDRYNALQDLHKIVEKLQKGYIE